MFRRYPVERIKTGRVGKPRRMYIGGTWPGGHVAATVERYEREEKWDDGGGFGDFRKMNEAEAVRKIASRIFESEPSLRCRGEDDDTLFARIAKDIRNMLVAAKKNRDHVPRLGRDPGIVRVAREALVKG